jgi:hypothetical protein
VKLTLRYYYEGQKLKVQNADWGVWDITDASQTAAIICLLFSLSDLFGFFPPTHLPCIMQIQHSPVLVCFSVIVFFLPPALSPIPRELPLGDITLVHALHSS